MYLTAQGHRHEVTITNYEAAPNPADHKTEQLQPVSGFVSWANQDCHGSWCSPVFVIDRSCLMYPIMIDYCVIGLLAWIVLYQSSCVSLSHNHYKKRFKLFQITHNSIEWNICAASTWFKWCLICSTQYILALQYPIDSIILAQF